MPLKRHNVNTIISGAQIGADIAGLKAARQLGLETGGFVLKNCKTLAGDKPEWIDLYGLTEIDSYYYAKRTALNVEHSDGTVRFAQNFSSPGEICTLHNITRFDKPYIDIPVVRGQSLSPHQPQFLEWLISNDIHTLNVAGNGYPFMEPLIVDFLLSTLKMC